MSLKNITPSIACNGTAEKAIELYKNALGAKVEAMMRFADAPGMKVTEAEKPLIMHSLLRVGGGTIMVMDTRPDHPVKPEGNVQIALEFDDPAELEKAFEKLSSGGSVTLPVQNMFWGARFAMLTDAHGVRWMLNAPLKQA